MAGVITGNVQSMSVVSVTLSPSIVATITTSTQAFTVPGVLATDACIHVSKPTAQTGLGIAGVRVSGNNEVSITFINPTAGGITPTAAEVYRFCIVRPDSVQTGFAV